MGPNGFTEPRTITLRFVDTNVERPRWRFNFSHRINTRPMVSVGTSSDRIFSPAGTQAFFVTVGKSIPKARVAPYFSVFYSEWERRILFPAGVNVQLGDRWDFLPMTDGRNSHAMLTYRRESSNISLLLIRMRDPGVGMGWSY
ncbi:MAG: hypothetical protein ACOVT5_03760 [Armatimonadaceae bacterium]